MNTILIKNIEIGDEIKDVLISDSKIEKISDKIDVVADEVIDGQGCTLIPSFVNMHTHTGMSLMRGCEEDLPLFEWLQKIWEVETRLDGDMIYWGTKLACLEMIKSGTTAFNDMYWDIDYAAKAVSEMGIRGFHSYVLLDLGDKDKMMAQREECIQAYKNSKNWKGLNTFAVAVHAPYSVDPENIKWARDFTADNGLMIHTHISETQKEVEDSMELRGMSPVKYLDSLGMLDKNVLAAHCVWVNDEDIKILADRGVTVIHNVNSNLKLSSGYKFPLVEYENAGANVTLGTDGPATSNNLDMMETMKTTALLQKAWRRDPSAVPVTSLMELVTKNSFKALGIDAGRVEEGAVADLVIVDTNSHAFVPHFNFVANLIYSAHSNCVRTVICNGNVVMKDWKVEGEEEILAGAEAAARRLYRK